MEKVMLLGLAFSLLFVVYLRWRRRESFEWISDVVSLVCAFGLIAFALSL